MPEPEEENRTSTTTATTGVHVGATKSKELNLTPPVFTSSMNMIMDLDVNDLDLDSSWPLDQIGYVSNPLSPFLVSSATEQPCSPLWAFSDADHDGGRFSGSGYSPSGFRLTEYPLFVRC